MKVTSNTVFDILSGLRTYFQGENVFRSYSDEEPFRSELYSSGQLDNHAKVVARTHKLSKKNPSDLLLKRLDNNEKILLDVRNLLVETLQKGNPVTPGAEWLLDNFYLIEEQIVIAKRHLPKGYSEELPYLAEGNSEGMPRVYDIVLEIISHSDGRVDVKNLSSFIASYQTYTLLTLGELWAIPIMLRLAVIENIRRVARTIALDMIDLNLADYWADQLINTLRDEPGDLILTIADMARSKPLLNSPFVAGFTRKLQGKGPALALPLNWMEQQLAAQGLSSNDLVWKENQKQAADQVSVRNSIGTLRFIGSTDWKEFVETLSSVEQVLRQDPSGTYSYMDFATRDNYRHKVESIAKSSKLSETEVARKVLELASPIDDNEEPRNTKKQHVGYYLLDKGVVRTKKEVGARSSLREKFVLGILDKPVSIYILAICLLTIFFAGLLFYFAYSKGEHSWPLLTIVFILAVSAATQLSVSLVNWISTILIRPRLLPRMDFSKGIPSEFRTLVVVPTMLLNEEYIDDMIEGLEIRFLANMDDNLHYCLLTDFVDADKETLPEDAYLLEIVKQKIEILNRKYVQPDHDIFFLFHRPRTWNEKEKKWMGYERKRGKLSALNAFIQGKSKNEFSLIVGDYHILQRVKYVLTLDSDTQLPRESAWQIIATMAHPLNHAVYNTAKRRVTEGYGILQPRVAASIPKINSSLYLRMQGTTIGIDPYTKVSSDVYQDLFNEGSFIGKGIYDVAVFEQAVHDVFPENRILSHDLLEGCYTRSGLIGDVLLYEDNPSKFDSEIKRRHRWIRGDWQVGAWMLPFLTNHNGKYIKNKLSGLSRWKIFDNLRRSIVPQSLLLLLILGWLVLSLPWLWTFLVTLIILFPDMVAALWQLFHKPQELETRAHIKEVWIYVRNVLIRFVFGIAVLPYEAYTNTDAILRTNWRMLVSKRKLLEWTPSATEKRSGNNPIWSTYLKMWITPFVALVCLIFLIYTQSDKIGLLSPLLLLWFFAPAIAWRISQPEEEIKLTLPEDQMVFLNKTARRTWAYFEEFVTEEDNWLPPDNFQEQPVAVLAHRTSPTNMGLALLSNLTAYDFGYIGVCELVSRTENTLNSMRKLERYKGHFLNWYDTQSCLPLYPRYVSSVDSGNLAGHLITLKQGLIQMLNEPVYTSKAYDGFIITVRIIKELAEGRQTDLLVDILNLLKWDQIGSPDLPGIKSRIEKSIDKLNEFSEQQENIETELYKWTQRLIEQFSKYQAQLEELLPWIQYLPVPDKFPGLGKLNSFPSLLTLEEMPELLSPLIDEYELMEMTQAEKLWLENIRKVLETTSSIATEKIVELERLLDLCDQFSNIDFDFLYTKTTGLLTIGYNVDEQRIDNSYYDLLASEARLGIFVGIAQGKLPQESWFALSRLLTNSGGDQILLSWSGSMFEYLMPQLIMPNYPNTLLDQTNISAVNRQIDYASQRGIPWGISESAYNMVDANLIYQYKAFGVPGLGLKRGLGEELVIAPYATMLALMVAPNRAVSNLQRMANEGFSGQYGFYEAIDYTPSRLPRGKTNTIIQSYMVHHHSMSFLSIAYLLFNKPMQRRFESDLRIQATLLLLLERIPRATLFYAHTADIIETRTTAEDVPIRAVNTANSIVPEIQLLSNGRYQVMVSNSGGGFSRWKDLAVTRWREDATKDNYGIFCYIKDMSNGKFWSNTYHPTLETPSSYEAVLSQGHVEFRRLDYGIETKTEIVVSPEDDTEMRRVRIINRTQMVKVLEITSYAEVVLATQASDESHPAFSNLFVQTEISPENKAIICTRRPRSKEETPPWMFHLMDMHGTNVDEITYETDRNRFIGRGRTLVHPKAIDDDILSGNQGSVLDPIVAIRYKVKIKPNQTVTFDLIYGMADTREACVDLIYKYHDQHLKKRAFELSWTHSQVLLRQINATEADAQLYDKLAGSIIYANPGLRADPGVIKINYRGQSGLWSHSISGDLPIVLLQVYDMENIELVKQMVQAHAYWKLKGLAVDLVIWNEDHGSYRQALQERIQGLITTESGLNPLNSKPGNIYVKSLDQISSEDRILFESVARIIINDGKGSLSEQINRQIVERALPPLLERKLSAIQKTISNLALPADLIFFNGIGGFTPDGKEYKIKITDKETTPAPWVNVLANPDFGTVVSESGSAYTWAINAHEYRITPWTNDPISDIGGEAFYIRDEVSGNFWSATPFPLKDTNPYLITHGFGYSTYEHESLGIYTEMLVFVDKELPVKFIKLKVRNQSGKERKLSATGFLEIILGDRRSKTNMHIIAEHDNTHGAILLRNRYNTSFADRVSYFKVDGSNISISSDRSEFIGRNRNLKDPQGMYLKSLSGRVGAGNDPCAALQVKFDLLDGAEKEIIFQIGSGENTMHTSSLLQQFADQERVMQSLEQVKEFWSEILSTVRIETPDTALNILANGWLSYQNIACRIFARSGFYQSGGAFGFRDQLQDILALFHSRPKLAKKQILLHASRQFAEGDVQHWWHPPEGRGVRTRCSDDLLWLPYTTTAYINATGDTEILKSQVGYLESRPLHQEEDSLYDLPVSGILSGSLYEHCVRAINRSLKFGPHGLPLIGSGDWNDGMDRVGIQGNGESVWLAFFLYDVLMKFEKIAMASNDEAFANTCNEEAQKLKSNIESSSWDGKWYLRAFFDDGTPLGSSQNKECSIDAIAQSWAVLSGAGDEKRQVTAMASLDQRLVNRSMQLIQLLDPAFNDSDLNPGYIKGYVPGVRENGGQYSHAAIWAIMAFAKLKQRDKVWELFNMINPVNHAHSDMTMPVYKVEPYVMAADIYANKQHPSMGGWTWYTGSSGWMYQFISYSLIGLKLESGNKLSFNPCFPLEWPFVSIAYRFGKSTYNIKIYQVEDVASWYVSEGVRGEGATIDLLDEEKVYSVEVHIQL